MVLFIYGRNALWNIPSAETFFSCIISFWSKVRNFFRVYCPPIALMFISSKELDPHRQLAFRK